MTIPEQSLVHILPTLDMDNLADERSSDYIELRYWVLRDLALTLQVPVPAINITRIELIDQSWSPLAQRQLQVLTKRSVEVDFVLRQNISVGIVTSFDVVELLGNAANNTQITLDGNTAYAGTEPVCGNGICEHGEICTEDSSCFDCQRSDCPYVSQSCPVSPEGLACSGHGTCIRSTGICSCFIQQGYLGDKCGLCGEGAIKLGDTCIFVLVDEVSVVLVPAVRSKTNKVGSKNGLNDRDIGLAACGLLVFVLAIACYALRSTSRSTVAPVNKINKGQSRLEVNKGQSRLDILYKQNGQTDQALHTAKVGSSSLAKQLVRKGELDVRMEQLGSFVSPQQLKNPPLKALKTNVETSDETMWNEPVWKEAPIWKDGKDEAGGRCFQKTHSPAHAAVANAPVVTNNASYHAKHTARRSRSPAHLLVQAGALKEFERRLDKHQEQSVHSRVTDGLTKDIEFASKEQEAMQQWSRKKWDAMQGLQYRIDEKLETLQKSGSSKASSFEQLGEQDSFNRPFGADMQYLTNQQHELRLLRQQLAHSQMQAKQELQKERQSFGQLQQRVVQMEFLLAQHVLPRVKVGKVALAPIPSAGATNTGARLATDNSPWNARNRHTDWADWQ
jgi:hypothetical protein